MKTLRALSHKNKIRYTGERTARARGRSEGVPKPGTTERRTSFIKKEVVFKKAGFQKIAGLDEAGRGPLAGPVVCAAVMLKKGLKLTGLNDSKLLSARKREKLYKTITDFCDYGLSVVSSKIIDSKGLIKACELGFQKAVSKLRQKPDLLLIDGCDHFSFDVPHKSFIRGDSRIRSIAAASIVAKVYRDCLMLQHHKSYPDYEFQRHKGYGTRLHMKLLRQFGPSPLHRRSFKPLMSLRAIPSRSRERSVAGSNLSFL